jgi:gliding motility-associated-like protein
MKKYNLTLVFFFILISTKVFSQCVNLDFSMGTFTNWQCYAGTWNGSDKITLTGPLTNRHVIYNMATLSAATMYDEVCKSIKKVPDGYQYSCRIGNSITGAQVDAVEYEMTVNESNSLLMLSFAWVMQQPGHNLSDQPKFTMTIKDFAGNQLNNDPCTNISFIADKNLTTSLACNTNNMQAKDWSMVGYSLEAFIGSTIRIRFEVRDCKLSGHYGYAYVVAECRPMKINLHYCEGETQAQLNAPPGFKDYSWTRTSDISWSDTGKSIIVTPSLYGDTIKCVLKSSLDTNCISFLQADIQQTIIDSSFSYQYDTCSRTATFIDLSTVTGDKKDSIFWTLTGPGLTNVYSKDSLFTYTFPDPVDSAKYLITLDIKSENGCYDANSTEITIYHSPQVEIIGDDKLCNGATDTLTARATLQSAITSYTWLPAAGTTIIEDTMMSISTGGTYMLEGVNKYGCIARDTHAVTMITLAAQITSTDVTCFQGSDGTITQDAVTGSDVPWFSVCQWTLPGMMSNGGDSVVDPVCNGKTLTNLPAGDYYLYVLDGMGKCQLWDTVSIGQPDSSGISADFTYSYDTCSREVRFVDMSKTYFSGKANIVWTIEGLGVTSTDSVWTHIFPEPIGNTPDTFRVKLQVTDDNGCSDTSIALPEHYIMVYPSPKVAIVGSDTLCNGVTDTLSVSVLQSTITDYRWNYTLSSGVQGNWSGDTIPVSVGGLYCLEVENSFGCVARDTHLLTMITLAAQIDSGKVTCYLGSDGWIDQKAITVTSSDTATAMISPWAFTDSRWASPALALPVQPVDTGAILSNLPAEDYYLYVKDILGCQLWDTVRIHQPDSSGIRADFTYDYDTCSRIVTFVDLSKTYYSAKAGRVWTIEGLGAIWTDSLSASVADSVWMHSFPEPLTHTPDTFRVKLTVYDANGCSDTSQALPEHYITIYPSPKVKIVGIDTLCNGTTDTLAVTVLQSTMTDYTWHYTLSSGVQGSWSGDSIPISVGGIYIIEATNTYSCIALDTHVVRLITLAAQIDSGKVTCYLGNDGWIKQGAIKVTSSDTATAMISSWAFIDSRWTSPALASPVQPVDTGASLSNLTAEDYYLYVKDILGCQLWDTVRIHQPDSSGISATFTSRYDTCARTVTFVDLSKTYYSAKAGRVWTIEGLGATGTDSVWIHTFPEPIANTPVIYRVKLTVYDANGCSDTSQALPEHYITIYPSPKVDISGNDLLCRGDKDTLTAQPLQSTMTHYTWNYTLDSYVTGTFTGDRIPINAAGKYRLAATNTYGCIARDTHEVTLVTLAAQITASNVDCYGGKTGTIQQGAITGGHTSSFALIQWTLHGLAYDGQDSIVHVAANNSNSLSNLPAGNYSLYVKDSMGCQLRDTVKIAQPDSIEVEIAIDCSTCSLSNGSIKISGRGGVEPYDFSTMSISGAVTPPYSGKVVQGLGSGIYEITLTDRYGCKAIVTDTLIAKPKPYFVLDSARIETCGNANGEIHLSVVHGDLPLKYQWSTSSSETGDAMNLKAGKHKVKITDATGCTIDTTIEIALYPLLTFSGVVTPDTCHKSIGRIALNITSPYPESVVCTWKGLPDTGRVASGLEGKKTYSVTVSDTFCSASDVFAVPIISGPTADFMPNLYDISVGTQLILTDISKGGIARRDWDFGDETQATFTNKVVFHNYDAMGYYPVTLIITDTNNCMDSVTKIIRVLEDIGIYIPNIFTPNNGDGLNDTWGPVMTGYRTEGYLLSIFDSWGSVIFKSTNPLEKWDGTVRGNHVEGNIVYTYRLIVRDILNVEHEYIGRVTVVR